MSLDMKAETLQALLENLELTRNSDIETLPHLLVSLGTHIYENGRESIEAYVSFNDEYELQEMLSMLIYAISSQLDLTDIGGTEGLRTKLHGIIDDVISTVDIQPSESDSDGPDYIDDIRKLLGGPRNN